MVWPRVGSGRHQPRPRTLCWSRSAAVASKCWELQQLLCAINWLRESVVNYGRLAAPLQHKLELILNNHSRCQRPAVSIVLPWDTDGKAAYAAIIEIIGNTATLALPDDDALMCLGIDASGRG
ncbi:TPA: hypothetical protein N0F65_006024 [Lagenidium giganteum]|uniref:Uncharacterized protein n=1 Tax=Lagenidium giganteum TaxID=4803 RepID=A0AAV2Z6F0_9STRA|nr:TPA: hypothetical protein N0F65_006024 [Lagenidium giganteum]